MTTFTLSGHNFAGYPVAITWHDGVLSGNPETVVEAEALAKAFAKDLPRALERPDSAHQMMRLAFADVPVVSGDRPGLWEDAVVALPDHDEDDATTPHGYEKIDLSPEDEAALERAWALIDAGQGADGNFGTPKPASPGKDRAGDEGE